MILVTDSHVSHANGNVDEFFQMLDSIAASDQDVVFLGDIFDLWVALPRYEEDIQKRFLFWCREQSQQRTIGFVEGNHEFYVTLRHRDHFSWCVPDGHLTERVRFVHGDLINKADTKYLRFRKLTKNAMTRTIVRFLPMGPYLVNKLKKGLKKTNKAFRIGLPEAAIREYAEACFKEGIDTVLVGHFHQAFTHHSQTGQGLFVLVDWFATGSISLLNRQTGEVATGPWREQLSGASEGVG